VNSIECKVASQIWRMKASAWVHIYLEAAAMIVDVFSAV